MDMGLGVHPRSPGRQQEQALGAGASSHPATMNIKPGPSCYQKAANAVRWLSPHTPEESCCEPQQCPHVFRCYCMQ